MPLPKGYVVDKPVKLPKGYALDAAASSAPADTPAPDFTTNSIDPATGTGYGLYRMGSYDFNGGQVTKPEIQVPYNRVQDAMAAGYKLHPDEAPRYQQDTQHNGSVSRATGQVKNLLTRMTEPMPDTPLEGNWLQKANAAAGNVEKLPVNVINRTARGLVGLPQSVAQTVTDIAHGDPAALESLDPVAMAENSNKGLGEDEANLGPMAALGNLGGDATTMYLTGKYGPKVVDTATQPMLDVVRGVKNIPESFARTVTNTGAGPVKDLVKKTEATNEKIDVVNADRIETQRKAQAKADYDHRANLLKLRQGYEQSVRDATEKARTGTAADRAGVQAKNLTAKQKYAQDVRDAQQKYQTEKAKAIQANAEAQRAHNQKIGEAAQQNRAATAAERAKGDQTAQLQVGGSQLIYGLNQLDKALRDRAAAMFDAVRGKVGAVTRPGADLGTVARTALSKISGSSTIPKPFSDILGKYPETDPEFIEYQGAQIPKSNRLYDVLKQQGMGEGAPPVTFGDLQGYYSETGAELAKGTLPGDVYQATKDLHNAIGDMMQKMANDAGAGKQFWDSRVFYRNYMDTFHEPAGPSGSGSPVAQALLAKDPEVAVSKFSGDSGDRGIAILRRYSDSLANLAQDVRQRAQQKVTVPARKSVADIPAPKTKPVPAGANLPLPPIVEPTPAPRAANLSLPPVLPEPTTVSVDLKPKQTISSPDLIAARRAAAEARAGKTQTRGTWVATWPVFQAMRALWGGHIPSIPTMALESAGTFAMTKATTAMMQYPPMLKFLTQARPEDLALIPPELRGDLPGLVSQAQRQGIKVSPALLTVTAAGSANQGRQQSPQAISPAQAIQAMQPTSAGATQ